MEKSAVLALDIGFSSIRILQYDRHEKIVDLVAINPLEPKVAENPARLEEEIQNTIEGSGATATDVLACVWGRNVVMQRFRVPADEPNPQEVLEWEIGQQVLGTLDGFRIDLQEIGGAGEGEREYLVAACRREYVDRLAGLLRRIRLNPVLVDVDAFALQNAFEANNPSEIEAGALLVFTEPGRTSLAACRNGMVYGCASLPGPSAGQEGKAEIQWLSARMKDLLGTPSNEALAPIRKIWLAGAVSEGDDLCKGLATGFPEMSVAVLNPFKAIKIREDLATQIKDHSALCSIAAGLLARGFEDFPS